MNGSLRPDAGQRAALAAMKIDVWERRQATAGEQLPVEEVPAGGTAVPAIEMPSEAHAWEVLEGEARACTRCRLHSTRTQVVFGTGDRHARWMVIGEAPGADEDRLGEPFVGRAGQLLNEMLRAVGLSREEVYIANIVKCRPPQNRDPKPDESGSCAEYLNRQIMLVRPHLILAVGRIAAQNLLADDSPVGRLRGRVRQHAPTSTPVVVTYHPAYLLRSPDQKRKAWDDLCLARGIVEAAGSS